MASVLFRSMKLFAILAAVVSGARNQKSQQAISDDVAYESKEDLDEKAGLFAHNLNEASSDDVAHGGQEDSDEKAGAMIPPDIDDAKCKEDADCPTIYTINGKIEGFHRQTKCCLHDQGTSGRCGRSDQECRASVLLHKSQQAISDDVAYESKEELGEKAGLFAHNLNEAISDDVAHGGQEDRDEKAGAMIPPDQ